MTAWWHCGSSAEPSATSQPVTQAGWGPPGLLATRQGTLLSTGAAVDELINQCVQKTEHPNTGGNPKIINALYGHEITNQNSILNPFYKWYHFRKTPSDTKVAVMPPTLTQASFSLFCSLYHSTQRIHSPFHSSAIQACPKNNCSYAPGK